MESDPLFLYQRARRSCLDINAQRDQLLYIDISSYINEIVPAQRTSALVTALEPPEQTHRVECVLAGGASLVRSLHVRRDDGVADRALTLSLQSTLDVLPEGQQSVHNIAVRKHDHSLDGKKPALPFSLIDQHSTPTNHQSGL